MGYTKLFSSIVTSTIWTEPDTVRLVWITMLAISDKNGEVQASVPGLARVAGVSVADCEAAIDRFMRPDNYSRTKDDEGRRIEPIDGGWRLLNHAKYRRMASLEDVREKTAERVRRFRERQSGNGVVTEPNATVTVETDKQKQIQTQRQIQDSDTDQTQKTKAGGAGGGTLKLVKFTRPTADEITAYCIELELPMAEAQKFEDYYQSNGWKVGRHPMKDWKAALRNWKRNYENSGANRRGGYQRPETEAERRRNACGKHGDPIDPTYDDSDANIPFA